MVSYEDLEPVYIGPTWKRNADGSWLLPEKTLGWGIAAWVSTYLKDLNCTDDEVKPFIFTPEQLRWLLWWYAVDDRGVFHYRNGVLQRLKGWGKDPLLAVVSLVELCGPCRFSHWGPDGEPVGKQQAQARVVIAAVNAAQTDNTLSLFPGLMTDKFISEYKVKPQVEIIRARGGCKIEAVNSSYRALEGKRPSFMLLNETQHWVAGNYGILNYETAKGNVDKMWGPLKSRLLAITNAYLPGEDSVAERMRNAYENIQAGLASDLVNMMYDSIEAPEDADLTVECLRVIVPKIRGDAWWLDVEGIIAAVMDTTFPPAKSRRMWLNQIVAGDDKLYQPGDWDKLVRRDAAPLRLGDEIVLGFDGGRTSDETGLVAIRLSDSQVFVLGHWRPPDGLEHRRWVVDADDVDARVRAAHEAYRVVAFYADVALWESYIAAWGRKYGARYKVKPGADPVAWDMRGSQQRNTKSHERLVSSILDGKISHDGHGALRAHVLNACRRENQWGVSFGKESRQSNRKVDLYAALMLAHEALYDYGLKAPKARTGRGYFL